MKLKKSFLIGILLLIFISSSVYSTKFIKEEVKTIKNHKGYPAENFKPKIYYGLSVPEVKLENNKDYSDFRKEYFRERSKSDSFFAPLNNIDEISLNTLRKGVYHSDYEIRREDFEDKNMNRINLFISNEYTYTNSLNYKYNNFY